MEFQDDTKDTFGPPSPPYPPYQPQVQPVQPPPRDRSSRRGGGARAFWWFMFISSILGNIALFLLLIGTIAYFVMGGSGGLFEEHVIQGGVHGEKIAVISISGIIDSAQVDRVQEQLRMARKDEAVQGLIVKINSPGGTISASDQIYNALRQYREKERQPVFAFMQGIAASGGYYAASGCEQIVAEPTVITGSIGVIFSNLVVQDLFENKLGIQPVVVKSGRRKDWPSSFRKPSEEELTYINDRLIEPAYERFLQVVETGRQGVLTMEEIRPLADGGIYSAQEAKDQRLVDNIGYLDDAIKLITTAAGLQNPRVVEYKEMFRLVDLLGVHAKAAAGFKLDRRTLDELTTPEILYMWKGY